MSLKLEKVTVTKPEVRETTLAGTLYDLDIPVIPTSQVEAFKKRFLRKTQWPTIKSYLSQLAGFIAMAMICAFGCFYFEEAWAMVTSAVVSLFFGALIFASYTAMRNDIDGIQWFSSRVHPEGLREHEGGSKATRISKILPEAVFEIDHLAYDPFLKVSFMGQTYYIEHWDEPEFVER